MYESRDRAASEVVGRSPGLLGNSPIKSRPGKGMTSTMYQSGPKNKQLQTIPVPERLPGSVGQSARVSWSRLDVCYNCAPGAFLKCGRSTYAEFQPRNSTHRARSAFQLTGNCFVCCQGCMGDLYTT
jgi:hypothetical protein